MSWQKLTKVIWVRARPTAPDQSAQGVSMQRACTCPQHKQLRKVGSGPALVFPLIIWQVAMVSQVQPW